MVEISSQHKFPPAPSATFDMLRRLNPDAVTGGLNITIFWTSGHNLELMAECGLEGDYIVKDIATDFGTDGRKAVEHVGFRCAKNLIGQQIAFSVKNHAKVGNDDMVEFTIQIQSRLGRVVATQEYKIENIDGAETQRFEFEYTFQMHNLGAVWTEMAPLNIVAPNVFKQVKCETFGVAKPIFEEAVEDKKVQPVQTKTRVQTTVATTGNAGTTRAMATA